MTSRHPLLWFGCADADIVAACPPAEWTKLGTLGGLVLSSSVLAGCALGWTACVVGASPAIATAVGIFGGLSVMTLDRFVISTMRRQSNWFTTILSATPRLVFAVAFGQIVTMVILLFVFRPEIAAQVATDRQQALYAAQRLVDRQDAKIGRVAATKQSLEQSLTVVSDGAVLKDDPQYALASSRLAKLQTQAAAAQHAALCERDGTCGSHRFGAGGNYEAKKAYAFAVAAQAAAAQSSLDRLTKRLLGEEQRASRISHAQTRRQLTQVRAQLAQLQHQKAVQSRALTSVTSGYGGLLAQVEALGELTRRHTAMRHLAFWLWAALLLFDLSPAIAKTMLLLGRPTLYENLLNARDGRERAALAAEEAKSGVDSSEDAHAYTLRRGTERQIAEFQEAKNIEVAKYRIALDAEAQKERAHERRANGRPSEGGGVEYPEPTIVSHGAQE